MQTVYKYEMSPLIVQVIEIPSGGVCRHVGEQNGNICLWVEVDTDRPMLDRTLRIVGTGHPLPKDEELDFLGTVPMANGLVFHIYEVVG